MREASNVLLFPFVCVFLSHIFFFFDCPGRHFVEWLIESLKGRRHLFTLSGWNSSVKWGCPGHFGCGISQHWLVTICLLSFWCVSVAHFSPCSIFLGVLKVLEWSILLILLVFLGTSHNGLYTGLAMPAVTLACCCIGLCRIRCSAALYWWPLLSKPVHDFPRFFFLQKKKRTPPHSHAFAVL